MKTKDKAPTQIGYANQIVTKPPAWHTLVVFDILFNNLTTGLYLVTAVGETGRALRLHTGRFLGLSDRARAAPRRSWFFGDGPGR